MIRHKTKRVNRNKVYTFHCDTVSDLGTLSNHDLIPSHNRERHSAVTGMRYSVDYAGLTAVEQVRNLLDHGWPDGAERVRSLAQSVESQVTKPVSIRRKLRYQ